MTPRFSSDRDSAAESEESPLPLPVLFHLMDVSRPRRPVTAQRTAFSVHAAPEIESKEVESDSRDAEGPAEPLPMDEDRRFLEPQLFHSAETQNTPSISFLETNSLEQSPSEVALDATPPTLTPIETPLFTIAAVSELNPHEPSAHRESTISPQSTPVSSRSPADRSIRPRTTTSETWITSHGKYIALGFLMALASTIYLARTNRHTNLPIAVHEPHAHPGDAGHASRKPDIPPTTVAEATHANNTSPTSPAASDVSPATLIEPAADSKAELHAPAIQQVATPSKAADQSTSDDGLFRFPASKRSQERVATRVTEPTTVLNHTFNPVSGASAAPATPSAVAPISPPVAQLPASQPIAAPPAATSYPATRYPTTPFPAVEAQNSLPASPPIAAPAFPNHGGQFSPQNAPLPPQPATAWSVPAASAGMPPQFPSQDSTARGQRHERTGSGIY
jgi:hypothetical protein